MRLLGDLVRSQARLRPGKTAVVFSSDHLTYAELESRSNRVGHQLARMGCRPGDRVLLLVPKSLESIVAVLGVLKAGAIYVPLDPDSPPPRLLKMAEACDTSWLLAGGGGDVAVPLAALTEALGQTGRRLQVGWLGPDPGPPAGTAAFGPVALDQLPDEPTGIAAGPDDPAYILFTSGSTGTPKGVVISHRNVLAYVDWANSYFGIGPDDRLSGHPPLHFDLSAMDMYCTFAAGAELHLVPPKLNLLAPKVADFIRSRRLTQWFSVPSVLNYLAKFDSVRAGDFPELRRVIWCGEVLPVPTLQYWMGRLPHVAFTNLYGPTETTIASSYYTVPKPFAGSDIPIGQACAGEDLLVLDERLAAVPAGEVGDLYIGGIGLSTGYWRDPEKTAGAFITRRENGREQRLYRTGDLASVDAAGLLHFHGRADTQIKSRGYRIELGEIEAALDGLPELRESAVVAVPTDRFEGWLICCAYVPGDASVGVAAIQAALRALVPSYMVPTRWKALERLPRNANGKVDRPLLKSSFLDGERASPPPP